MTDLIFSVGFLIWGAIILGGGSWAMYAGHRERRATAADGGETGGIGGYLLGGLIVVLGAAVLAIGILTL